MKSVLLSSVRRRGSAWKEWVGFEFSKSLIPIGAVSLAGLAGLPIPFWVAMATMAIAGAWVLFVGANALPVTMRLDRRREAFLKVAGYDLGISVMSDNTAWRHALSGRPRRDYLVALKQARLERDQSEVDPTHS
ncbi:MAG: hypothetical protein EON91_10415 [Brevundimonas sp.]|uniref:hypothetical protein n=1 Tax=Brevundimonas sp. TaxID=1871086 RepID=UPI001203F27D|nr:hypothetical protein [Brevundimonas sp.]RZJ17130.1 MAG: hypothetical protein EON91_10415 [Brevundimonas sp.]